MSRERPPDSNRTPMVAIHDEAETLFAECLDRFESEGERAIDAACERRPDLAPEIRSRFEALCRAGLVSRGTKGLGEFPERLGEFKLLRRIGGGGMGVVYLAEQTSLGRRVALKLIRPENLYFPSARERFRREIESVARTQHHGVVPIFAVGDEGGIPYYAMEWIDGRSLLDVLDRLGGFAPERLSSIDLDSALGSHADADRPVGKPRPKSWTETAFSIVLRIAEALRHVHERGVIHRDVKPSNVMLTASGRVVLLDFGLSRSAGQDGLTRTGAHVGSLPYMAPEQLRGDNARVGARTDVYALGVTLYELLTLRVPYRADSPDATQRLIFAGEPEPIRSRNRAVSRDAQTVCLKAMDRDPARRYASAAEFARDLLNVLERRTIEARRPGALRRAWRCVERHPATTSVLAGSLSIMLLALTIAWRERTSERTITLLSDIHVVRRLFQEADGFWPANIDSMGSIDRWIRDAEALVARAGVALERLEDLRGRANPYTDADRAADASEPLRRKRALEFELASLRRKILSQYTVLPPGEQRQVDVLEAAVAAAEAEAGKRRTWRFDRIELQWELETLTSIASENERLVPLLASVREQRAATLRLHETCIENAADAWRRAIEDVSTLPVYGGLVLPPQKNLIPLWRNPESGLWEFLHRPTGELPTIEVEPDFRSRLLPEGRTGVVLVLLPGGRYHMGAMPPDDSHPLGGPNVDPDAKWTESPVHPVDLDAFFMSKYELTVEQARRLGFGERLKKYDSLRAVSLIDLDSMSRALSRVGLEIPTEAQWEYACRAGTTSPFSSGSDPATLFEAANVADSEFYGWTDRRTISPSLLATPRPSDGFADVAPIGSLRPNAFGLHDVHGNVAEYCRDVHSARAYRSMDHRPGDGLFEVILGGDWRVARGGAFCQEAVLNRSACREVVSPSSTKAHVGFRPSRRLER